MRGSVTRNETENSMCAKIALGDIIYLMCSRGIEEMCVVSADMCLYYMWYMYIHIYIYETGRHASDADPART